MPILQTGTLSNQNISTALLVGTYTALAEKEEILVVIMADQVAGNGDYSVYLTRQRAGAGSAYKSAVTTVSLASGVTAFIASTISLSVNAGDVLKAYVLGLAGDTTTPDITCEFWDAGVGAGAILTNITAPALADYLTLNFSQIKTQLNWSDSVEITAVINRTFEAYGVSTEAEATDLTKLHALADVAVWQQALNDISLDYAFSADGASFHREQAVDAIQKNLENAEMKAIAYLPAYQMTVHTIDDHPDWTE